jgi:MYXO-CTERM domain-containing protein
MVGAGEGFGGLTLGLGLVAGLVARRRRNRA